MSNEPNVSGIISIELSQFEGLQLFEFIEGLIRRVDVESEINTLEGVQEKLGDTNALALWLREDVTLELHHNEVMQLLDYLSARHEQADLSPESQVALAGITNKLSTCLPGDFALQTQT